MDTEREIKCCMIHSECSISTRHYLKSHVDTDESVGQAKRRDAILSIGRGGGGVLPTQPFKTPQSSQVKSSLFHQ